METGLNAERFGLVMAVALVVAYTLTPFEFSSTGASFASGDSAAATFGDMVKFVGHFGVFLVLGVLVAAVYQRTFMRRGLGWITGVAAIFCVGLEAIQMLDVSRHARITDLLLNFSGLSLGVTGSLRWPWLRDRVARLRECLRRYTVHFQAAIFLLGTGGWFVAGLYPASGALKLGWDTDFHLVIGNETDRNEPWRGEIRYLGIYGKALTVQEATTLWRDSTAGSVPDPRAGLNHLVGYDFMQGPTNELTPSGALGSPDLILEIPAGVLWTTNPSGLLLKEPAFLASRGSDASLTEAITDSGEFSIEAWARPLIPAQEGPARILSLSEGIWMRNFMLGQEESDLVFRVRNGVNGTNGLKHALRFRNALDDSLRHVVAVYDHGVSSFVMDGKCGPIVDLREPLVYLLLGPREAGRAVGALLLTLAIALPGYSLFTRFSRGWMRHLIVLAVTFFVGSLPFALTCLVVGGPWRLNLFFWFAIALITVYPLGLAYVYRS